ncbi:MAG: GNAT family N-acetyltransferase [Cyanobacteria bacterium P01_H01_bin.105]
MGITTFSFVPSEFTVPAVFETDEYRLRMLTVNDVVKDFDAVITSAEHLKGIFPPPSTWPDGLTLEQDLIDLGWHQKEFQRRTSFAYTMMSLDESCCLGCVYFYPSGRQGYDAYALLWVRQSELASGLEDRLFVEVKQWLTDAWPFESVGFPGRDLSWEDWFSLPE